MMCTFTLFVQRMTQLRLHKHTGKYHNLENLTLELALEVRVLPSPFADQTTSRIVADWERM